nr:ribonuclease H-like domain-containing protein [Tanacetum cinerariifolium]
MMEELLFFLQRLQRNILLFRGNQRDIWNAVKARFGRNAESKKMRKSMLKQEFLEFRIGDAGEFALMGVTFE